MADAKKREKPAECLKLGVNGMAAFSKTILFQEPRLARAASRKGFLLQHGLDAGWSVTIAANNDTFAYQCAAEGKCVKVSLFNA